MGLLVAGLVIFLGTHLVPAIPSLRRRLVDALGEQTYKLGFAAVSVAGLVLTIYGYGVARPDAADLYLPPDWTRHLAMLLMPLALISLAASQVPSRLGNVLKHPMLVAIKLWAIAHLLVNGDAASVLLFGAFLAYAVVDRISVKSRPMVPRAPGTLTGDIAAVVIGLAVTALLIFYAHGWLFGVPLT